MIALRLWLPAAVVGWLAVTGRAAGGEAAGGAAEADRIAAAALAEADVHDCFDHIAKLAEMKAVPQLARLFARDTDYACCVYQEILGAIHDCATRADIPALIPLIDTETDESGPEIRGLLARLAGVPDGAGWNRAAWERWWRGNGAVTNAAAADPATAPAGPGDR